MVHSTGPTDHRRCGIVQSSSIVTLTVSVSSLLQASSRWWWCCVVMSETIKTYVAFAILTSLQVGGDLRWPRLLHGSEARSCALQLWHFAA